MNNQIGTIISYIDTTSSVENICIYLYIIQLPGNN